MSSYSGAPTAKEARDTLGSALAALQEESDGSLDREAATRCVAQAVGALLQTESASTDADGDAGVKTALELLSESLARLEDVRSPSSAIERATEKLASAMRLLFPLTAAPAEASAPAVAGGLRCTTEIVVESSADEVAARLLDFTGLHRWHPGLEDPTVEGSGIGAVRSYRFGGQRVRERLDAVDDGRGLAYTVLEGPLPITDLRARYELFELSGKTRVVWSAEGGVARPELADGMAGAAAALQDTSLRFLKIVTEEGVDLVPRTEG